MTTKGKRIVKIAVNVVIWAFLVFALCTTVFVFIANSSGKDYPVVNGKCLLCVETNSMNGDSSLYAKGGALEGKSGFKAGDLIICKVLNTTKEKSELKVGDVITFYHDLDGDGDQELNTHRIVEVLKESDKYRTKGDNNNSKDEYTVSFLSVEAVWTGKKVAGIGSVIGFFRSSTGFLTCVVIPLAIFFVYELINLCLTINNMKAKKAPKISKEEEEIIKQRAIEEYLAKQQGEKKE